MDYNTYRPRADLESLVICYWTLEVAANGNPERQRIVPDGSIELAFILGDDIKRYTSQEEFILQPRAMVLGHITTPFFIEPTGYVNTFAIRFYPYGFANFSKVPVKDLANKETPLSSVFEEEPSRTLEQNIVQAADTRERIEIVESFLLENLKKPSAIDAIVKSTLDILFSTKGRVQISAIFGADAARRRQLERKFVKSIGMSPKQLAKVLRLQAALKMILKEEGETLTRIAYESEYYDQAHFIKDFREFTGINPKEFLRNDQMALSSIFYK